MKKRASLAKMCSDCKIVIRGNKRKPGGRRRIIICKNPRHKVTQ